MSQAVNQRLDRRRVVGALVRDRSDLLVIAGLGSSAWDLAAAGDDPRNFYLWGAMGSAAMIGLGLALARPDPVLVITGDGEQLMGLGGLATIGVQRPANLSVVVLDNEHYGETGMQASHTAHGVDLSGIARASGFTVQDVTDEVGVEALRGQVHRKAGPLFADIKVLADEPARVLPLRDGADLRTRFRNAVLGISL